MGSGNWTARVQADGGNATVSGIREHGWAISHAVIRPVATASA
jgi:hypothetical protein